MTDTASRNLVILLHGVGSNGADLAPLGDAWTQALPGTVFASPNAPERSSFGQGYQWFSVAGVTPENRAQRIVAGRAGFDTVIASIIADKGFADRLDRVALVGFSQGTIMSLDAVASGRFPVGAVVGFSGRLASPKPLTPKDTAKGKTPILLVHGTGDPVIPSFETEEAEAELKNLGFPVETQIEAGLGHTISPAGVMRAAEFLSKIFKD
jgi:phospholipase/carboxylesterase